MARFVIVGNSDCRRVALFQAALARLDLPVAPVVLWADLLDGKTALREHLCPGDIVRFESTGRDSQVEQKLLARGVAQAESEGFRFMSKTALEEEFGEWGRIWPSRQWYLGLSSLFHELQAESKQFGDLQFMHDLGACLTMSDKIACHAQLQDAGVVVAPTLGTVENFEVLEDNMKRKGWSRVFGKLAHGSSASGVFALQTQQGFWRAQTTVEMVEIGGETRLYNSRRPQIYETKRDIARLVNALARERLTVERWLPKAMRAGKSFDCRFVVVRGKIRHSVMRLANGPLTNLHLGNERSPVDALRQQMGEVRWHCVEDTLQRAMSLFPSSLFAGADVAFSPSLDHHAVLELNAWGDLLPGILCEGRDSYEEQIRAILAIEEN
ncbi:hypothetical protein EON83_02075 [bacterium]|nr:MAG: hypothetical protein EON83_02075 [bacterium]